MKIQSSHSIQKSTYFLRDHGKVVTNTREHSIVVTGSWPPYPWVNNLERKLYSHKPALCRNRRKKIHVDENDMPIRHKRRLAAGGRPRVYQLAWVSQMSSEITPSRDGHMRASADERFGLDSDQHLKFEPCMIVQLCFLLSSLDAYGPFRIVSCNTWSSSGLTGTSVPHTTPI